MAGLADTISRLNKLKALKPGLPTGPGKLHDLDDFGSNPGQLRARFHVPQGLKREAPLVVVLHGCTQNAAGYDASSGWSQLADELGFALIFPEQRRSNNPNLCFNWFLPDHSRRGSGEALSIKQMVDTMAARHGIDPARVFVTGLSAGGAMASVMLATYPEVFAGGAIIAGLPYGVASSVPTALQLMNGQAARDPIELMAKIRSASDHDGAWPIVSVWHGTGDSTVVPANAGAIVDQWRLVHDVAADPSRSTIAANITRRSWRDAQGREVIEEHLISGMAHGVPLDPASGTGQAAAFMLDVGICSSRAVLRFWGLIDGTAQAERTRAAPSTARPPREATLEREPTAEERRPAASPGKPAASAPIGKIIEDALRAAGLMR